MKFRTTLILLLLISALNTNAQDATISPPEDELYQRGHIGLIIGVSALSYEKKQIWGHDNLTPVISPGGYAGISYFKHLDPHWSLEFGVSAGIQSVMFKLLSSDGETYRYKQQNTGYVEIPLRVQRRFPVSNRVTLVPLAGFSLRNYYGYGKSISYFGSQGPGLASYQNSVDMQFPSYSVQNQILPFLQIGVGTQFRLKNNLVVTRLVYSYNLSSRDMMTGQYYYTQNRSDAGQGIIRSAGNTLSLETGYIFSRIKQAKILSE